MINNLGLAFENSPSTNTPLNNVNLNKITNKVDEIIVQTNNNSQKILTDIIMGVGSGSLSISTTSLVLPITKTILRGTGLTITSNSVVIGSNINLIRFTAHVFFDTGFTAGDNLRLFIFKNGVSQPPYYGYIRSNGTTETQEINGILEVVQGDTIQIQVTNASGARGTINGERCYFIVEKIE